MSWEGKLVQFVTRHELSPTPTKPPSTETIIIIVIIISTKNHNHHQVIEVNGINVEGQTPNHDGHHHNYHNHHQNHNYDQVIEVNGINVEGQTPNHVLNILREAEHTITFKLIPNVGQ